MVTVQFLTYSLISFAFFFLIIVIFSSYLFLHLIQPICYGILDLQTS